MKEWLETQDYDRVVPEFTYVDSRIDFYMERGVKHLHELAGAIKDGYKAMLVYLQSINQMSQKPHAYLFPGGDDNLQFLLDFVR